MQKENSNTIQLTNMNKNMNITTYDVTQKKMTLVFLVDLDI